MQLRSKIFQHCLEIMWLQETLKLPPSESYLVVSCTCKHIGKKLLEKNVIGENCRRNCNKWSTYNFFEEVVYILIILSLLFDSISTSKVKWNLSESANPRDLSHQNINSVNEDVLLPVWKILPGIGNKQFSILRLFETRVIDMLRTATKGKLELFVPTEA